MNSTSTDTINTRVCASSMRSFNEWRTCGQPHSVPVQKLLGQGPSCMAVVLLASHDNIETARITGMHNQQVVLVDLHDDPAHWNHLAVLLTQKHFLPTSLCDDQYDCQLPVPSTMFC